MKHWLVVAGAGLALFVVTVLGLLGAQGRLSYEGTRGVPVLSWFFPAPDEAAATDPRGVEDFGGEVGREPTEPAFGPGSDVQPAPMLESEVRSEGGLFRYPTLDSGTTAAEIEELFQRAHRCEAEAQRRLAIVEEREVDLGVRERDLADRERAIAEQMMNVDAAQERLDRRIQEFEERVLLVEKDEVPALLRFGRSLASFEQSHAAKLVMQEWESDVGRQRVVKVLTLMDSDDADRILARIPDDTLRELLIERLDVVFEPERR